MQAEGLDFFSLSLLDKRSAPRWRPAWASPPQLVNEVIGRLLSLTGKYPAIETEIKLRERVGRFQSNIEGRSNSWGPFYPGPLEGTRQVDDPELALTKESIQAIEEATTGKVGVQRCRGIVAVGPIWEVPDKLFDDAIKELDRSPIPASSSEDKEFLMLLGGLSHLAGLKRSPKLANLIASLGLRAAAIGKGEYSTAEILPEVLEASAAFPTHDQQVEWLGNVIGSFSFSVKRSDDAGALVNLIDTLSKYDRALAHRLIRARVAASSLLPSNT